MIAFAIFATAVLVTGYMAIEELASNPHAADGPSAIAAPTESLTSARKHANAADASDPLPADKPVPEPLRRDSGALTPSPTQPSYLNDSSTRAR